MASRPGRGCTVKIEGLFQVSHDEVLRTNNMEDHPLHPGPWACIVGLKVLRFTSIVLQDPGVSSRSKITLEALSTRSGQERVVATLL